VVDEAADCGGLVMWRESLRKDSDYWVSACRSVEVTGVRDRGTDRKTMS